MWVYVVYWRILGVYCGLLWNNVEFPLYSTLFDIFPKLSTPFHIFPGGFHLFPHFSPVVLHCSTLFHVILRNSSFFDIDGRSYAYALAYAARHFSTFFPNYPRRSTFFPGGSTFFHIFSRWFHVIPRYSSFFDIDGRSYAYALAYAARHFSTFFPNYPRRSTFFPGDSSFFHIFPRWFHVIPRYSSFFDIDGQGYANAVPYVVRLFSTFLPIIPQWPALPPALRRRHPARPAYLHRWGLSLGRFYPAQGQRWCLWGSR